jgi:hypothetical protein
MRKMVLCKFLIFVLSVNSYGYSVGSSNLNDKASIWLKRYNLNVTPLYWRMV